MTRAAPARLLATALAVLACALLAACEVEGASSIEITNARARFTTTDVGAVYLDITAEGAGDRLIAASTDVADDVQVHEVVSEGGSSMMRPAADGIAIEAGGRVSLEPGGLPPHAAGRRGGPRTRRRLRTHAPVRPHGPHRRHCDGRGARRRIGAFPA